MGGGFCILIGTQKKNHIISVSSHTRGNDESVLYGPYFDDNFHSLFDYVSRGCR